MELNYEYGLDLDWYIVDKNGYVAMLCTNGDGFSIQLSDEYDEDEFPIEWIDGLKHTSDSKIPDNTPIKYWENLAKKGLFAFDYDGSYKKIAEPTNPIIIPNNITKKGYIKLDVDFNKINKITEDWFL